MRSLILLATAALAFAAPPQRLSLTNRQMARTFEISEDGHVRTVSLTNQLDHRVYPVRSREFELLFTWERMGYEHGQESPMRLTGQDFTLESFDQKPGELAFHLLYKRFSLHVDLVCTLAPGDFYMRKRLVIRSSAWNRLFLDQVVVESLETPGAEAQLGGFGQPIYAGDLFLGLEYPAGFNRREGGRLTLGYYSGQTTGPVAFQTESAVIGVAEEGLVRPAFFEYVKRIRSGPVRPVTVFNTWYDMQNDALTEAASLERMATLKAKLLDPFNLRLDSFVLDDGWDTYAKLWKIHPQRFGGDFTRMDAKLSTAGSSLGLWFGPVGGYGKGRDARIAQGLRDGYEITLNGRYFCLAGPKYRELFKATLLEMVRRYHVTHFKFDGLPYGCNDPTHGHLPGIYSREAHVRAFIDILKAIRAADPKVFLNITTSNWLSPWWLMYTDVVFMGGYDYGFLNNVPAVSEREKAITYRDSVLYDDFRRQQHQFPQNSLMTIGIIKGTLGHEGGMGEKLESWVNNAIMNYSRGVMMTELYLSPAIIQPAEWTALGGLMQWAQANSALLLHDTRMVGGDPAGRQVYGYAHFQGGRGIVTLRNPSIETRTVKLKLDLDAGVLPGSQTYRARAIYPYTAAVPGEFGFGDSVELTLEGFEVLVVEFGPEAASAPAARVDASQPVFHGDPSKFTLTLGRARRLAVLCEAAKPFTPRLLDNGRELKLATVSPKSGETGVSIGEGGWAFLVAELPAGTHNLELKLPGVERTSAWLLEEAKISTPPIPAAAPQTRHVTHLFTKSW